MTVSSTLSPLVVRLVGPNPPLLLRFWDGSTFGPHDAPATVVINSPNALRRLATAPGELGFGRAYVAGEIDLEGDIFDALAIREHGVDLKAGPREWVEALRAARAVGALRATPLPPPPEEARLRGRRHSRQRDAAAISHHNDVGDDFYRIVLGPSLTYSCAYFENRDSTLEDAQHDKHELICRKLRLRADERVLDVGCGWGSFLIHAASEHGVRGVGVTLSHQQAALASKRVAEAGLTDRIEIRLQDERDVSDGPYDAIASVGMFEHVGTARLHEYFTHLHELLRPQGRVLNHGIARPPRPGADRPVETVRAAVTNRSRFARRSFIDRYVFPDGEVHEIGDVVRAIERCDLEVRDVESLREHYALTLRRWVDNLQRGRDAAVEAAGERRYRVWLLYMAASARNFEAGRARIHQVLAVRADEGRSGVPLRRGDTVL